MTSDKKTDVYSFPCQTNMNLFSRLTYSLKLNFFKKEFKKKIFFLKNVGGLWPQYVLVQVCGIVWYFIYYNRTIVASTPSNENYVSQDFV